MGFFAKLFGLSKVDSAQASAEPVEYKGYLIYVEPRSVGGQFGVGARIVLTNEEGERVHQFIRADQLPSRDSCTEVTLNKAKMTIDQLGERLFS